MRRRKPLGALPVARLGVAASQAGLVLDLLPEDADVLRAQAPETWRSFLAPVATETTVMTGEVRWAVQVGALPDTVAASPVGQALVRLRSGPRFGKNGAVEEPLDALLPSAAFVALPRRIPDHRDYLSVSTYDPDVLPLNSLVVIGTDTLVAFGWLSSRAFWLWCEVVRANHPTATTLLAYNTFPAPALDSRRRRRLEVAVDTVLRSRSHLNERGLPDLYARMPEQLAWAHSELDAVVDQLLGIPADASDDDAMALLLDRHRALAG